MAVGYLISSHVRYSEPLTNLLASMQRCGVPSSLIMIAVGGATATTVEYSDHVAWRATVDHNSFDYTALIEFTTLGLHDPRITHVLPLHDTMEFTESTHGRIQGLGYKLGSEQSAGIFGGQCNLVVYSVETLLQHMTTLASYKNCTKRQAIDYEGALYNALPPRQRVEIPSTCDVLGECTKWGARRIVERYSAIELLKYKANWGQPGIHIDP